MEKEKTEKWLVYEEQAEVIVETWENVWHGTEYRTEYQWVECADCVEGKSDEEIKKLIKVLENVTEWNSNKKKYRNFRVVMRNVES